MFVLTLAVALAWLAIGAMMPRPGRYSSYLARIGEVDPNTLAELTGRFTELPGVVEAVIAPEEGVAYLKIDRRRFDADALARIIGA